MTNAIAEMDPHDPDDHARLLALAASALDRAASARGDRYVSEAARNANIANSRFEEARANISAETIREALEVDDE